MATKNNDSKKFVLTLHNAQVSYTFHANDEIEAVKLAKNFLNDSDAGVYCNCVVSSTESTENTLINMETWEAIKVETNQGILE